MWATNATLINKKGGIKQCECNNYNTLMVWCILEPWRDCQACCPERCLPWLLKRWFPRIWRSFSKSEHQMRRLVCYTMGTIKKEWLPKVWGQLQSICHGAGRHMIPLNRLSSYCFPNIWKDLFPLNKLFFCSTWAYYLIFTLTLGLRSYSEIFIPVINGINHGINGIWVCLSTRISGLTINANIRLDTPNANIECFELQD